MKASPAMARLREQDRMQALEARARFAQAKSESASIAEAGRRIGVSFQRASQLWARIRDEFAELVAEGITPYGAGEALHLSPRASRHVWAEICKGLGERP